MSPEIRMFKYFKILEVDQLKKVVIYSREMKLVLRCLVYIICLYLNAVQITLCPLMIIG